ncbi:uncharacterized protein DNG_03829 [Cephalotrichum gorgonifer]|uniref:WSC domain-containing protein n=1 Tax=Cephalotrichum gorgonifer TaxID=2041049 RepID=A0AAE8SUM6_9PEZI|nr:uncharacterized protein DNG_03829 [Cephalotrichum gorgonifer]
MPRLSLLGFLWAGGALAQDSHAADGFTYEGCVDIWNPAVLELPLDELNCTPEDCQKACVGFQYAAISATTCKCYGYITSRTDLSEESCDNWCNGNPEKGRCGSYSDEGFSNLYGCEPQVASPAGVPFTTVVIPPYSAPPALAPPLGTSSPAPLAQPEPPTDASCEDVLHTSAVPHTTQSIWTTVVVQPTPAAASPTPEATITTTSTFTYESGSAWQPVCSLPAPESPDSAPAPCPFAPSPSPDQGLDTAITTTTPLTSAQAPKGGCGGCGGAQPATPNPGYTSTANPHKHSSSTLPSATRAPSGTAGADSTGTHDASGCGAGGGASLFAVALALGIAFV